MSDAEWSQMERASDQVAAVKTVEEGDNHAQDLNYALDAGEGRRIETVNLFSASVICTGENNVDAIETEQRPFTFIDWVAGNEKAKLDGSFLSIEEDTVDTWEPREQIIFYKAVRKQHSDITQPLASFLLEQHGDRITHEVSNMYDLAVTLLKEGDALREGLTEVVSKFPDFTKDKEI